MNPFAKEMSRLNKAKPSSKRTDEDRMDIARVEFEGSLYFDKVIGPYIPGSWIFKNLLEAARTGRRGKKIEGGIQVINLMHPLIYSGPRTVEKLWGVGPDAGSTKFVDFRPVRVGQAKVDRCRPIFEEWAVEAEIFVDPSSLDVDEFRDIAEIGGRLCGYGDYRQQYGRFDVEVKPISSDEF
jgi:hypothetical protein